MLRSQLAWMKRLQLSGFEVRWDMVGGVVSILFDWVVALLTGVFALDRSIQAPVDTVMPPGSYALACPPG